MTVSIWILIILIWLLFGFIASGFTYAYFQRKYTLLRDSNRKLDFELAISDIPHGLISLLVIYKLKQYKYGWLFPGVKP